MRQLLVLAPEQLQTSVYPAGVAVAAPLWKEGRNVAFRENGIVKVRGGSKVMNTYTPTGNVRELAQGFSAGKRRLFLGTTLRVEMLERSTTGVITNSLLHTWATATGYVNFETWGNWLLATNNIDPPLVWKNTGGMVALANVPFTRVKILKRKGPYLLAFANSLGEDRVDWSHTSDIENWTVSGATEAGNFVIRDLDSNIAAVTDLGDRLAVYSGSSLVLGSLIGRPNVFGWRRVLGGIGAVSPRSVVAQGPFNYGLTTNGIFKTDGNSYLWLDDPAAQRWLIDTVDWNQPEFILGYYDDFLRLVTWHFMSQGGDIKSISIETSRDQFVTGDLDVRAASPRTTWDYPIVAGPDNLPLFWQQGELYEGSKPAFYLRTRPLDFGARDFAKILNLIRVDGKWGADVKLRVGALEHPEGSPEWYHDAPLVTANYFPNEREAAYHVVEISGSDDFHMTGMEFFGVPGGVLL